MFILLIGIASEGHSEYFAYDGIHLEYSGVKALSNEIIKK